jgi:hypothetical protein
VAAEMPVSSTDRNAMSRLWNAASHTSVDASEFRVGIQVQSLFADFLTIHFGAGIFSMVLLWQQIAETPQVLFQRCHSKHLSGIACVMVDYEKCLLC